LVVVDLLFNEKKKNTPFDEVASSAVCYAIKPCNFSG